MYLSQLQKYIIFRCFDKVGRIDRKLFREFYKKQEQETSVKYQESIITKSLERLINKGLMIGYGKRTAHRWFITHVRLTNGGLKEAKKILASGQRKLKFNNTSHKTHTTGQK
ncbi:hypothetical protein KJ641_04085 [Patescibacteria group bacterium]|nr:hypothetical protein [Patescibacteria group bacterium]